MATAELDIIVKLRNQASKGLRDINNTLTTMGSGVATGAAAGIAGVTAALGAATMAGLDYNNSVEQAGAKIQAFTKDHEKTAEILEMVQQRASQTPFAYTEMANAASALMPTARAANAPLEDLLELSEILAASNPAQGLEGASVALREAVSGDYVSLIERFNLPRQYINQLKEEGVPALEIVQRSLQELGFDTDLVANMANTAEGRWSTFQDTLQALAGQMTAPIFQALSGGLGQVNEKLTEMAPMLEEFAGQVAYVIEGVIKGFGDAQGPLNALVEYSGELPGAWVHVSDAAAMLYKAIEAITFVMAPLIPIIKDNIIPILIALAAVIGTSLVAAFVAIVGPMIFLGTQILLVSAAIGGLVLGSMKLYQHVTTTYPQIGAIIGETIATMRDVFDTIVYIIDAITNAAPEADKLQILIALGRDLGGPWETIADIINQVRIKFIELDEATQDIREELAKHLQPILTTIAAVIGANIVPILMRFAGLLAGALFGAVVAIVAPIALAVAKFVLMSIIMHKIIEVGTELFQKVRTQYPQIETTISKAINSVIAVFQSLWATVQTVFANIQNVVQTVLDLVAAYWTDNSDTIMSVVNTLVQTVQALFTEIGTAVMGVMTEIQKTIATILPVVVQFWNDNGAEIISTVQSLAMKVVPLFQSIAALVGAAITAIGAITQTVLQYVQYIWTEYGDEISAIAIGAFRFIADQIGNFMDTIQGIIDLVTSLISGDWQGMANALQRIADSLYRGMVRTFQLLSNVLSPIFTTIGNFASSTFTSAFNTVSTLATNMSNAISSAFTAARNSLQTGFDAIVTQISSFGTTFTDVGGDLAESFINGFNNWLNGTAAWASSLASAIGQVVSRVQSGIAEIPAMGSTAISAMVTNLRTWLNNTGQYASDVASAIGTFIAMIRGPVASLQSMASTAVANMITNFRTWLNNPTQYAADVASAINRFIGMVSGPINSIRGMGEAAISTMVDNLRAWLNNTTNYTTSLAAAISNLITAIQNKASEIQAAGATYASALLLGLQQWIQNVLGTAAGPQLTTAINALLTHINLALSALVQGGAQLGQAIIVGMANAITGAVQAVFDAIWSVITRAAASLPEWVRNALNITNPTRPTPPTPPVIDYPEPPVYTPPPPTTGSSAGSMGAAIVINIGSVRDARDIDAIKRAVSEAMDEAARRGIVQSQLPRGI